MANAAAAPGYQLILPRFISFFYLQERFEQWFRLHTEVWRWMSYQVLEVHHKIVPSHFVHMIVEPRWDGGDLIRRSFRVKSLSKYDISYLGRVTDREICSMAMDPFISRQGYAGFGVLCVIHCPPLVPAFEWHILPYQYATKTERRSEWIAMVTNDIEMGSLSSVLTDTLRPYPRYL